MTEGVEKAPRAGDADGYPLFADGDSRGVNPAMQVDAEEKEVIGIITGLGFEYLPDDKTDLVFRRLPDGRPWPPPASSKRIFPRAHARPLLEQFGGKIEEHPAVAGLMIPSRGYVELICSRLEATAARRAFRLGNDELNCSHSEPNAALPSLPYPWPDEGSGESAMRIHLSGDSGEPCVEISNASPLAMLLYGHMSEGARIRLAYPRFPFLATMKLSYAHAADPAWLGRNSQEIATSLSYELNVRNDVIVELDARSVLPDLLTGQWAPAVSSKIRYPRTRVQHEVAVLFGFASQAADDPLQAFLCYYKALEYFFPLAVRKSAFKQVRQEIQDPAFDLASDASMLRIVKAAAGPTGTREVYQLRALIKEYVQESRLDEFFQCNWGSYFTRHGPIKDVPHIDIRDEKILAEQVADRIYQIRNRIVHSKADSRWARVLLPRSSESNALTPDVLLVRLLATEAISIG